MAITDRVRVGQTVQFHVRDAASAREDLELLLAPDVLARARSRSSAPCRGR
jgi:small ligand-binding sensory domain FIST